MAAIVHLITVGLGVAWRFGRPIGDNRSKTESSIKTMGWWFGLSADIRLERF